MTCWDLKRVSHTGQRSSICCSVVIGKSPAPAPWPLSALKGKKRASRWLRLRLTDFRQYLWHTPDDMTPRRRRIVRVATSVHGDPITKHAHACSLVDSASRHYHSASNTPALSVSVRGRSPSCPLAGRFPVEC